MIRKLLPSLAAVALLATAADASQFNINNFIAGPFKMVDSFGDAMTADFTVEVGTFPRALVGDDYDSVVDDVPVLLELFVPFGRPAPLGVLTFGDLPGLDGDELSGFAQNSFASDGIYGPTEEDAFLVIYSGERSSPLQFALIDLNSTFATDDVANGLATGQRTKSMTLTNIDILIGLPLDDVDAGVPGFPALASVEVIPEPSVIALLGLGGLAVFFVLRRRR